MVGHLLHPYNSDVSRVHCTLHDAVYQDELIVALLERGEPITLEEAANGASSHERPWHGDGSAMVAAFLRAACCRTTTHVEPSPRLAGSPAARRGTSEA